jgi:hypothetical protein
MSEEIPVVDGVVSNGTAPLNRDLQPDALYASRGRHLFLLYQQGNQPLPHIVTGKPIVETIVGNKRSITSMFRIRHCG